MSTSFTSQVWTWFTLLAGLRFSKLDSPGLNTLNWNFAGSYPSRQNCLDQTSNQYSVMWKQMRFFSTLKDSYRFSQSPTPRCEPGISLCGLAFYYIFLINILNEMFVEWLWPLLSVHCIFWCWTNKRVITEYHKEVSCKLKVVVKTAWHTHFRQVRSRIVTRTFFTSSPQRRNGVLVQEKNTYE
jgi:hypothetical protein